MNFKNLYDVLYVCAVTVHMFMFKNTSARGGCSLSSWRHGTVKWLNLCFELT
jgi:hypothetical protein